MEDYYTIESLKRIISKLDFLKLQRAAYPIITEGKIDDNFVTQLITEHFFERLMDNGISISHIDTWLDSCTKENLDVFLNLVNPDISYRSFDEYSYNELLDIINKISNSVYNGMQTVLDESVETVYLGSRLRVNNMMVDDRGNFEAYVHYNYDRKAYQIVNFLKEKADVKYIFEYFQKYGLENFEDLSYEDISVLLLAILNNSSYDTKLDNLVIKMKELLKTYDKKRMPYVISELELKYLSNKRMECLCKVLYLANMTDNEVITFFDSEIDIDLTEMYMATVINLMNEGDTIKNAYDLVCEEKNRRRNNSFRKEALLYADLICRDLKRGRKTLKIWFYIFFCIFYLFFVHYFTEGDDYLNISIRNHVVGNFKDSGIEDIRASIDESVGDKDEITLPGLGVFFEILWDSSEDNEKEKIIKTLYNKLKKNWLVLF